jgi:hypothetical protein
MEKTIPVVKVNARLAEIDSLLQAITDVAEVGRGDTETSDLEANGRFIAIKDLLAMYRERVTTLAYSAEEEKAA